MIFRMGQVLLVILTPMKTTSPSQRKVKHYCILRWSPNNTCRCPISPPSNVMVAGGDYETDNFSITISWEESGGVVDEYIIQTNTTTQPIISTTTTTVVLEGEYNVPLEIRVSAFNCAGSSAEVTEQVIVGMC